MRLGDGLFCTGAAGFIGSNFVLDWFASGGGPVVSLDKLPYAGNRENLASLEGDSRHVFVQVIDDAKGHTLAFASTLEADMRTFSGDKTAKAKKVGELVAERAKKAGIESVVFDRGGNKYAGRVAAIADGAREGGLSL